MRREGALHVPLDTAQEGVGQGTTHHSRTLRMALGVCVACTHVCAGLHTLLGGLSP